jgi:hypothetical protein
MRTFWPSPARSSQPDHAALSWLLYIAAGCESAGARSGAWRWSRRRGPGRATPTSPSTCHHPRAWRCRQSPTSRASRRWYQCMTWCSGRRLRLGQHLAGRSHAPAPYRRGRGRPRRADANRRRAGGVPPWQRLRQPVGRRHAAFVAGPWGVPLAGGPSGCPGVGQRLPLPPGRRLPGQPTDPPATRVRRTCHHAPIHAPRRSSQLSAATDSAHG